MWHRLTHRHAVLAREGVGCVALCSSRLTGRYSAVFYTEPMVALMDQGVRVKGVVLPTEEIQKDVMTSTTHQEVMAALYRHQLI